MISLFKRWKHLQNFTSFQQKEEAPTDITVKVERECNLHNYKIADLQRVFNIEYLFHLKFATPKIFQKTFKKSQKALDKELITSKQLWLGKLHQKEITSFYNPDITIKWIDADIGFGVFTNQDLPARGFVGEYTGLVRKRKKSLDWHNSYCFEFLISDDLKSPFTIDAQEHGNFTRFINHSDKPNLVPELVFCHGCTHVILFAKHFISAGSQLLYNYGPDYWKKRENPKKS